MCHAESGTPVAEIIRKMGISEMTFYRWKRKCADWELRRFADSSSAGGWESSLKTSRSGSYALSLVLWNQAMASSWYSCISPYAISLHVNHRIRNIMSSPNRIEAPQSYIDLRETTLLANFSRAREDNEGKRGYSSPRDSSAKAIDFASSQSQNRLG